MSYAHTCLFIRRRPAEAIPQNVKASKTEGHNGFRIGPERRRRNQRISRSVSIVQAICTYNIGGRPLVLCIRRRHIIRYIYAITTS